MRRAEERRPRRLPTVAPLRASPDLDDVDTVGVPATSPSSPAFQLAVPSGNSSTSSVYSLFWTSRPSREGGRAAGSRRRRCRCACPTAWAWSAALLLASGSKTGSRTTQGVAPRDQDTGRVARRDVAPCRPATVGSTLEPEERLVVVVIIVIVVGGCPRLDAERRHARQAATRHPLAQRRRRRPPPTRRRRLRRGLVDDLPDRLVVRRVGHSIIVDDQHRQLPFVSMGPARTLARARPRPDDCTPTRRCRGREHLRPLRDQPNGE